MAVSDTLLPDSTRRDTLMPSPNSQNPDLDVNDIETGRIGRWQRETGQRLCARLHASLLERPQSLLDASQLYRASTSFRLAFGLAFLIHAGNLVLACWGLYTLFTSGSPFMLRLLAVMIIAVCWTLRPYIVPRPDGILGRDDFPQLYAVADRVAAALGVPPIDGIVVDEEFNAYYLSTGLGRGKRYMGLGLPLLYAMTDEERIAIIAHELSHGANGDPLRGRFLRSAIWTLRKWARLIRPINIGQGGMLFDVANPLVAWLAVPFELFVLLCSNIALWAAEGINLLVMRQSQRAEYLADVLAATVAGREPMRRSLRKLALSENVHKAFVDMALLRPAESLQDIVGRVAHQPEAVFDALAERSRKEGWRVDATHPPTALRIALIERQDAFPPAVGLSPTETTALDAELQRLAPPIHRELMNLYREFALPSE